MTPIRRQMMLKIADDDLRTLRYLYVFDQFVHCDAILQWIIRNELVGKKFLEWIEGEYAGSPLRAGAAVAARVNGEREARPVIAGRDFRLSPDPAGARELIRIIKGGP
jgi:hypothetical protein